MLAHFPQVTLACDGQTCKAHKMVLSACSPYFKTLLEENPSKHPIIILKDVSFNHLQAILEFMWVGYFPRPGHFHCLPLFSVVNIGSVLALLFLLTIWNKFLLLRYAGEVNVSQEQLPSFLKTADRLKVKGLAETQSPFSNKREGW